MDDTPTCSASIYGANARLQLWALLWIAGLLLLGGCSMQPNTIPQSPTGIAQAGPTLQVEPAQGWAGHYVQVTGSNWPANQLIMIQLEDAQGRSGFIAASTSDAEGDLATGFVWPVSERWLQQGTVQIVAQGSAESTGAHAAFQVVRSDEEMPLVTPVMTATATISPSVTATETPTATETDTPLLSPIVASDLEVPRLETPPVIDGNLAEWTNVQGYLTPFIVEQLPEWDASMDVEAVWRLGWDEDALYFGVNVVDDLLVQENTPQFSYFGDSLEIELDTERQTDWGPTVSRDDFQFLISPGNFQNLPAAVYRFQGTEEGRLSDAPGTSARVTAQRTDTGYTLEFAIPWRGIGVSPQTGLTLGATLNTNDNDMPGSQRQQFLLLSNVAGRQWSTPNSWGTLTLR